MQAIRLSGQGKGRCGPVLPVDWHHIGMSVQHDTAIHLRSDGSKNVRAFPCCVIGQHDLDAMSAQIVGDVTVDTVGRTARQAVKRHQMRQNGDGRVGCCV